VDFLKIDAVVAAIASIKECIMSNFTEILNKTTVSLSSLGITTNKGFKNQSASDLRHLLANPRIGVKDGVNFLRTNLRCGDNGECLTRSNKNANSTASVLVLDCDKRIDKNGEILEGAPDPHTVSRVLREHNIGHILYGSYSHYTGKKGNRYRILLLSNNPYTTSQLSPTIEFIISLINIGLGIELLANATENCTWAQPWYTPRKPADSKATDLYIEHLDGDTVTVQDKAAPPQKSKSHKIHTKARGEISPIQAFNDQYPLTELLNQYSYKRVYISKEHEKWLSPDSKSGSAGITVKGDKFYSHHSDTFNDGYWHDAFDLMRIREGLSERDAVIKAAQKTIAPNGSTVDEFNKKLKISTDIDIPENAEPIAHTAILDLLLEKIPLINFRKLAEIESDDEKLKKYHYYILAIETILETAKKYHWGICRNHDFIYVYNGAFWSLIDKDDLKSFLGNAAEKMGMDKFHARDFNFRDQLYKQFIALAHLPKPDQPKDTVFVNLLNGTFEITPSGTHLKPFDRANFLTYQLPFSYDPDASAPLFQKYLDKVLPDIQLQKIMAEYIGYIFIRTSTLKLEKALLLYGKGANGKSVFYEIIRKLLGEQNTSEYSLQTLTDEKGYQRAMIANKLVNYASEINGKLEASIFKQLVSGEAVEARLPYGEPFIMSDYAKLIFNCNDLPRDTEQTEAYFRRFLIIPFNVTIPEHEQNKQLAKKIIDSELPGVFNWVLDGMRRVLKQQQFTDSDVVSQARAQYEKESDSVKLFLDEANYSPSIDGFTAIKDLYREYRTFCQDNGYHSVSSLNFRKRLEHAKIMIERKNVGNVAFISKTSGYSQAKWGE
jgi:putative DNA primase/helicase